MSKQILDIATRKLLKAAILKTDYRPRKNLTGSHLLMTCTVQFVFDLIQLVLSD